MTDRALGINALNLYRESSLIKDTGALVAYFDALSPGLIELWGKMFRNVKQPILKEKFRELAAYRGLSFPSRGEINQAFLDAGATVESGALVAEGLADTLSGLGTFVLSTGAITLLLAAGVAYFALFTDQGRSAVKFLVPRLRG